MRLYPFSPLVLYVAGCSLTGSGQEDALLPHSPAIAQASAQAAAPHPLAPRRASPNLNPPRLTVGPRDTSHIEVPSFTLPSSIIRSDAGSILGRRSFSETDNLQAGETGRNVTPRLLNRIRRVRQSLLENSRASIYQGAPLPGHGQSVSEASDDILDTTDPLPDARQSHSEESGVPLDTADLLPAVRRSFSLNYGALFDDGDLSPTRASTEPTSWPSLPLPEPLSEQNIHLNRDLFGALFGYAFDPPPQQSQPVRALTHLRDDRDEEELAPQTPPRHDEDEQSFQTPERRAPIEFPPESYQTPQSRINRFVPHTPPPIHGRTLFSSPLTPEENRLRDDITSQQASRRGRNQQTVYVFRSLGSMLSREAAQVQAPPSDPQHIEFMTHDRTVFEDVAFAFGRAVLDHIRLMISEDARPPSAEELAHAQACAESLGIEPSRNFSRARLDLLARAPYSIYSESLPSAQFDVAANVRPGCGICGEDYQPGEAVVSVAGCVKHHGHRTCLSMWLALPDKTCPYCRRNPFADGLPAPYTEIAEPGLSDREPEDVDMVVPDSSNYVDEQLTCGELPNFPADSLPNLYDD